MTDPHITIYRDLEQGSPAWLEVRRGTLTASEMHLILTPARLEEASNEKEKRHLFDLAAQRISGFIEPHYTSYDMERGHVEEAEARREYAAHYGPVEEVGFVLNTRHGFPLGCSPDGLVGSDGGWECKSRQQGLQIKTIVENIKPDRETIPAEYVLQVQTCLLVTERAWWDFTSYSGGLPMATVRVYPDELVQEAILEASRNFERRIARVIDLYHAALESPARLLPTERILDQEII